MTKLRRQATWVAVAAVVLISLNLRPGATVLGPIIAEVLAGLGQGAAWGGILTALPGVCFAFFGSLAVALSLRIGLNGALWLGMAAAAIGLGVRAWVSDAAWFLALTVLGFAGIAIGNVLVPAFMKRRFPERVATLTAAYSTCLAVGATTASALAVPMARSLPGGWRAALFGCGLTALAAVVPMVAVAVTDRSAGVTRRRDKGPSLLRSRRAVALGVFFGIQSMQAYVQFGWVSQMFRDGGLDAAYAGLLVSIIPAFGIPAGLVMARLVDRVADLRPVVVVMGVLLAVGYLGILYAPTFLPWLWATALGLSGAAFPMALALITARSRDPHVTARLSGFGQTIGYTFAALGPFLVGVVHGVTGGWAVPLWVLIASSVAMVVAGFGAVARGYVDDDLAGP